MPWALLDRLRPAGAAVDKGLISWYTLSVEGRARFFILDRRGTAPPSTRGSSRGDLLKGDNHAKYYIDPGQPGVVYPGVLVCHLEYRDIGGIVTDDNDDKNSDKKRADYYELEYNRQKQIRQVMIDEFEYILCWQNFTWQKLAEVLKAAVLADLVLNAAGGATKEEISKAAEKLHSAITIGK